MNDFPEADAQHPSSTLDWSADWEVGIRLWIERDGNILLSEELAELLAAISVSSSISGGAKLAGVSYRHAWKLVQQGNAVAGDPLVFAEVGGKAGGGATVTPKGKLAVSVFDRLQSNVRASAASLLQKSLPDTSSSVTTLHLAAAVSLQEVVARLLTEFALQRPNIRVRCIFGPSNELVEHIRAGAPTDLAIFASSAEIESLKVESRIASELVRKVASNALLIVGRDNLEPLKRVHDLASSGIKVIALAESDCPLGRYSKQLLDAESISASIASKLLLVDNSRAVLSAVESGAADAGIVYASDRTKLNSLKVLFDVPRSRAIPEYFATIIKHSSNASAARTFFDFLKSPSAKHCFRTCGFRVPR
jgi:molybdate transport system substrate-binding protein